jgi:hypothetical protein
MEKIVTKEWLIDKINIDPVRTVGRALVAIFKNQTGVEQSGNKTKNNNGIGFTKADARIGCIAAKYYLKHKSLEQWQLDIWLRSNKQGLPRIVKYASQLNAIANAKQTSAPMAILQTFNLTNTPHA